MKAIRFSETLVTTYKTTRRQNQQDHNQHIYHCENFKSQHKKRSLASKGSLLSQKVSR
jgi:hypothetical protein